MSIQTNTQLSASVHELIASRETLCSDSSANSRDDLRFDEILFSRGFSLLIRRAGLTLNSW